MALLTEEPGKAEVIAGGTDLLSELKDGLRKPRRLVSLAGIEELDSVEWQSNGVRLGASLTLAHLVDDERLNSEYPILGRSGPVYCDAADSQRCYARRQPLPAAEVLVLQASLTSRATRRAASTAMERTATTAIWPSWGAELPSWCILRTWHPRLLPWTPGWKLLGLRDVGLWRCRTSSPGRTSNRCRSTYFIRGEIVTSLLLPKPIGRTPRSIFLKAQDRTGEDFALASVAASVSVSDGVVSRAPT